MSEDKAKTDLTKKVLVTESISAEGIKLLRNHADVDINLDLSHDELLKIIGNYEGLIVRSQTRVTEEVIEAGNKLQIIGRAGVGVDNIDVDAATRKGIVVVNAPTSNTTAAAEHTIALMLSLARHIPQANSSLKSGAWKRSHFVGIEVKGKTIGVVGLGNVGSEVARRARALDMKVIASDPFISLDYARNLNVELVPLEQLLKESDFITLHIPQTNSTEGLIGEKELATVKPSVRIINTARGGLIDEDALVKAIKEKRIAGAALDVFRNEPLTSNIFSDEENIIITPHLGASTAEAQTNVAADVVNQVIAVFSGQTANYSVNAPFISVENISVLAPFIKASTTAGKLAAQLAEGQMSSISIRYEGEISNYDTNVLKAAVLGGLLEQISEERVNLVNANIIATRRGLAVVEQKDAISENYASLITAEVKTSKETVTVSTTVVRGETHIARIDNYWLDIYPAEGYFLFCDHLDRPGLLGQVGRVTGDANIDISAMHVGRLKPRGEALMILTLDEPVPEEERKKLLSVPDVYSAKFVKL
ncbi:MAG: phosphoglycerate dehydrogenase [Chloroflexi bacterium RBG_13_46_14]|nr:MAG: phosphoglycerate dehydrogenase [Chloroflexi bacterium RBG_13_46_14]